MHENLKPIGQMRVDRMVFLVLLYELLEAKYGDVFIEMANSLQHDVMLFCENVPLELAVECMTKKLQHEDYSMRDGLMSAMEKPEKMS